MGCSSSSDGPGEEGRLSILLAIATRGRDAILHLPVVEIYTVSYTNGSKRKIKVGRPNGINHVPIGTERQV